jgi:hypothetical protein
MAQLLEKMQKDICTGKDCENPGAWKIDDYTILCAVCWGKLIKGETVYLMDGNIRMGELKRVRTIG